MTSASGESGQTLNATVAGSVFRWYQFEVDSLVYSPAYSGTWRLVGIATSSYNPPRVNNGQAGLFVRIS